MGCIRKNLEMTFCSSVAFSTIPQSGAFLK